eukprot:TRINITY_DN10341_c0_g1_i1.p1 TRINITY_DN10341_c0_g1~~TRINITY_DN10341_c0_g1_i1.p1  ORF type:complete len:521 (+),score=82.08 TRINITY_DN10341_c0_g1_i1:181-1743(+)
MILNNERCQYFIEHFLFSPLTSKTRNPVVMDVVFIKKGTKFRRATPLKGFRKGSAIIFDEKGDQIGKLFIEGSHKSVKVIGADKWIVVWYKGTGREATFLQNELDVRGYKEVSHPNHIVDPLMVGATGIDWDWVSRHIHNSVESPSPQTEVVQPSIGSTDTVQFLSWSTFFVIFQHKWRRTSKLININNKQRCLTAWFAILFLDAVAGILAVRALQTFATTDSEFSIANYFSTQAGTTSDGVANIINKITDVTLLVDSQAAAYTRWLLGWPAGFKGNTELNSFLGSKVLLRVLTTQAQQPVITMLGELCGPTGILLMTCVGGVVGLSGCIGLVADILSLLFLRYVLLYILFGFLYSTVKGIIIELSRQMAGKKFNPLKNIVDQHSFDAHQMLVSIIGFALCTFLFPTICVYFIFMFVCYASLRIFQEVLLVAVMVLLSLPFFAVPLHLLSPVRRNDLVLSFLSACPPKGAVFLMGGSPIPLSKLFTEPCSVLSYWVRNGPFPSLKKALINGTTIPITVWS